MKPLRALIAGLAFAVGPFFLSGTAGQSLPDLVVDEAELVDHFTDLRNFQADDPATPEDETDCAVREGLVGGTGIRRLLRFPTVIVNRGDGPLHLGDLNELAQTRPDLVRFDPCHGHPHLLNFSEYRLWTPEAYRHRRQDAPVLVTRKVGWCVEDSQLYDIRGQRLTMNNDFNDPRWGTQTYQTCSFSGISPSWADIYGHSIEGQYIDITGLPSGQYVLEIVVNPVGVFQEAHYQNNDASIEVTIE